jgi:hypothetical protein
MERPVNRGMAGIEWVNHTEILAGAENLQEAQAMAKVVVKKYSGNPNVDGNEPREIRLREFRDVEFELAAARSVV